MPRFVLLYHECPTEFGKPSHWDFMLEHGDALRTWSLDELPFPANGDGNEVTRRRVQATRLADHRMEYLQYEGLISGNRGTVTRIYCGTYEVTVAEESLLEIDLQRESGVTLRVRLEQIAGEAWQLTTPAG